MRGGDVIRLDDPAVLVRLNRSDRARRFTLSVRAGEARLTAPRAAPDEETRAFLLRQSDWLRAALSRAPARQPVAIGVRLPIDGRLIDVVDSGRRRGPCRLDGAALLTPAHAPDTAVAAFLKARAQARLAPAASRTTPPSSTSRSIMAASPFPTFSACR